MAQLDRHPEGLKMGELSRRMMVTGGNVTGITDQLQQEGLVSREALPTDRRAYLIRLTPAGAPRSRAWHARMRTGSGNCSRAWPRPTGAPCSDCLAAQDQPDLTMKTLPYLVLCGLLPVLAACSSTPQPPQVTPVNATIKLGRVTEKTFLTRLDVAQVPPVLRRRHQRRRGLCLRPEPAVQQARAGAAGGPVPVQGTNHGRRDRIGHAPAAPGLEPGACVRVVYPDGSQEARLAPSNEC